MPTPVLLLCALHVTPSTDLKSKPREVRLMIRSILGHLPALSSRPSTRRRCRPQGRERRGRKRHCDKPFALTQRSPRDLSTPRINSPLTEAATGILAKSLIAELSTARDGAVCATTRSPISPRRSPEKRRWKRPDRTRQDYHMNEQFDLAVAIQCRVEAQTLLPRFSIERRASARRRI